MRTPEYESDDDAKINHRSHSEDRHATHQFHQRAERDGA